MTAKVRIFFIMANKNTQYFLPHSVLVSMKRFYILIITIFSISVLSSQNLPTIDYKTVHFGFNLGINVMDYGIRNSMLPQEGVIYQAEVATLMPGFSVGVFGDVRLCNYLNLRLVPTLSLGDRRITYMNDANDELYTTTLKSTAITVPLHLKYSAVRIKNYRPYLFAGGGVLFELSHDQSKPVLSKYFDYFVEFGFGWTIYTEYFRFSPEIKFALGFNNVITNWDIRLNDENGYVDPEFEKYTRAISRLTTRLFTLVFNFE